MSHRRKKKQTDKEQNPLLMILGILWVPLSFFAVELYIRAFITDAGSYGWRFSALWSLIFAAGLLMLPKKAGRVLYGIGYLVLAGFAIGEMACKNILHHMIWIADSVHLTEGAEYGGTIRAGLDLRFWCFSILLLLVGVLGVWLFPRYRRRWWTVPLCLACIAGAIVGRHYLLNECLFIDPAAKHEYYDAIVFRQTQNNYGIYTTFYDAEKVCSVVGYYQLLEQDVLRHHIRPRLPSYKEQIEEKRRTADAFYAGRAAHTENDMTGLLQGKNVIMVLMESMDDFLLNKEDTPTICRMMDEGINFTNFFTPIYSSIHTFNAEFCANAGYFLPTSGTSSLSYSDNDFSESLPSLLRQEGYSANTYHYNSPVFYNRGVMLPAIGFESYVCYEDYLSDTDDETALYDDCYMLNNETLCDEMFGHDRFYDYIITRNAHTPFLYDDEFAAFALAQHPEYKGKYANETLDVIECKARTVDDMFALLLQRLEEYGHLDDTAIVAFTDHYAYPVTDQWMVQQLSHVNNTYMEMRTPCFIWAQDMEPQKVDKTLNTADLLPTVLNLLGIDSGYDYLGGDAFDENYEGYVVFSDGAWLYNDVLYGGGEVIEELSPGAAERCDIEWMEKQALAYIQTSDAMIETDYYRK